MADWVMGRLAQHEAFEVELPDVLRAVLQAEDPAWWMQALATARAAGG